MSTIPNGARPKLLIVTGPSGAGKGVFIRKLLSIYRREAILAKVWVAGRRSRQGSDDRKVVSRVQFAALNNSGRFDFIHEYAGAVYGSFLPSTNPATVIVWDYPGDYPLCPGLDAWEWIGVLVLPSSRFELVRRLVASGRECRVPSAVAEHNEARLDLSIGGFSDKKWIVLWSGSVASQSDALRKIRNHLQ